MSATAARLQTVPSLDHPSPEPQLEVEPRLAVTPPARTPEKPATSRRSLVVAVIAVVAVGAGTAYYLQARQHEDTDDAQIDGDIGAVSPRIAGTIKTVHVAENDVVHTGDVLAEIDPADYQVLVAQSEAAVAQARALLQAEDPSLPMTATSNEATIRSASLDLGSAQSALAGARKEQSQLTATLAQAQANDRLAQIELGRATRLVKDDAIPKSDFDARQSAAQAASALVQAQTEALAGAKDRIDQQQSRVDSALTRLNEARLNAPRTYEAHQATVSARQAALDLAEAQLDQAKLNLSYTKILAPANGIIGKKNVAAGDRVSPGQELLALSETDSLWITANFRETQLARIRPHQPVEIHVDAIGADLHGEVESMGGATGSRLSVLPPENATGNYVKVVQRLPVRIHLDPGQPGLDRLRPGMSVEPKIKVLQ